MQVLSSSWHGRPFGHNRHGPKRGLLGSPSNTMWPGPRSTSVQSGILIHPAVWPQQTWAAHWGGLCPFRLGGAGSPSTNVAWDEVYLIPSPSGVLIHPAVWPQQTWADNWGAVRAPFWGTGSLSNTMSPGPRPTSVPKCMAS